jgi:hypothetical protein
MSTTTSSMAQEGFSSEGDLKPASVESVFAPLTRLPQSKSEQTAMQRPKHIIICLLDHTGCVLGHRCLSNTTCVIDLESFRSYGVCRVEVLRPTRARLHKYFTEWARCSVHRSISADFEITGYAQ